MAGLPKKYAKMGFKKGWKEYKKTLNKRKTSSSRTRKASNTRTSKKTVARRKTSSMSKQMRVMAGGFGYGAIREPMSDWTQVALNSVGLPQFAGEFTDEVVMSAISYYMTKGKLPFIPKKVQRIIGYGGLAIESARAGSAIAGDAVSALFGVQQMSTSGNKIGTQLRSTIRA